MLSRETADGLDLDTVTNQRRYHKRPEKNSICNYWSTYTENQDTMKNQIDTLLELNKIKNKMFQGSDSY